jgi:hypothetical protein
MNGQNKLEHMLVGLGLAGFGWVGLGWARSSDLRFLTTGPIPNLQRRHRADREGDDQEQLPFPDLQPDRKSSGQRNSGRAGVDVTKLFSSKRNKLEWFVCNKLFQ